MKKISLLYAQVSNENYKSFCTIDRENSTLFSIFHCIVIVYLQQRLHITIQINLSLGSSRSRPGDISDESLPWWRGTARQIWISVPFSPGWWGWADCPAVSAVLPCPRWRREAARTSSWSRSSPGTRTESRDQTSCSPGRSEGKFSNIEPRDYLVITPGLGVN